eukprot:jgi/Tetstr1/450518/TSEL_037554.t1
MHTIENHRSRNSSLMRRSANPARRIEIEKSVAGRHQNKIDMLQRGAHRHVIMSRSVDDDQIVALPVRVSDNLAQPLEPRLDDFWAVPATAQACPVETGTLLVGVDQKHTQPIKKGRDSQVDGEERLAHPAL